MRAALIFLAVACAQPRAIPPSSLHTDLDAQFSTVGPTSFDAWLALNLDDAVFISSSGFHVGREGARTALTRTFGELFAAGGSLTMKSKGPRTVAFNASGDTAWITDRVALRSQVPGEEAGGGVLVVSQVLTRRDGRWWIASSHWSVSHTVAEVKERSATGTWSTPSLDERVTAGAEVLVPLFGSSNALDVIAIDWFDEQAHSSKPGVVGTRRGGVLASLASKDVGWVAGVLEVDSIPLRVLAVYTRERDRWRLVQWHASVARARS